MKLRTKFQDKDFELVEVVKAKVTTYYDENKLVVTRKKGEVFTPSHIVKNMLDFVDYTPDVSESILKKHLIDNSCGEGAFLVDAVRRYIEAFIISKKKKTKKSHESLLTESEKTRLRSDLEKYFHGIEINKKSATICLENLNKVARQYGIDQVAWDVQVGDTLDLALKYYNQMDFVVGNPPFIRIHDLMDKIHKVKSFDFSKKGMTDLYIVFLEISLKMLNSTGKLCLITPNSWLTSTSGLAFRKYLKKSGNLKKIIDLEHYQPFKKVIAYPVIFTISKHNPSVSFDYYRYSPSKKTPEYIEKLFLDEAFIDDRLYLGTEPNLKKLKAILSAKNVKKGALEVKNGFATLADPVFIGEQLRDYDDSIVIDVIKGSTGQWTKCVFPYSKNLKPLKESEVRRDHPAVYQYLLGHKKELLSRSIKKRTEWYLFGRTQAILDVNREKLAISTIIKDIKSIKLAPVPAGKGVYSGLYITFSGKLKALQKLIISPDFIEYVKLLKKYKSGGYYTFSSKDLKKYLNYVIINQTSKEENGKRSIFESD